MRLALLALAGLALVAGVFGGLVRLGAPFALPSATAMHGALMIAGFLGTVLSLERAIALGSSLALTAPLASGLGALAMLAGFHRAGIALWLLAPCALFAASVAIVRRQAQAHTLLLALAALAWIAANSLFAFGRHDAAPAVWFAFLVLTIAAERLEMTRLMKRRPWAQPLFHALTALLLAGAGVSIFEARSGAVIYGFALAGLAAWLATFDLARQTVKGEGFPKYAAVALLGGYAWLAVAGLAWIGWHTFAPGLSDVALHSLGLGFVFSMILAHAPLIVPVIARRRMRFTPLLYAPLALLHASLVLRLGPGLGDATMRLWGGFLNAATLALFVVILAFCLFGDGKKQDRTLI